ncbi:sorting nexin-9-like [Hydra vulgaris]|uniref:Sorting nexin-9-like n=1 Tax=Hydra vulgaris TaxID=6087 RepID=A0ABM4BVE0_HYDVU
MASLQARVLYDFDGDPKNGELIIRAGDILAVARQDVGDGWWEGSLNGGAHGLFPAAYVELCEEDDVPNFPPPLPPQIETSNGTTYNQLKLDGGIKIDWDDDHSSTSDTVSQDVDFGSNLSSRSNTISKTGTVRKSINRFSNFVKSGGEDFLLGKLPETNISQYDHLVTEESPDGITWQPIPAPFTINVNEAEKKSKFKGMKSYITYSVQPSNKAVAVQHRFKHFDWLHERLVIKFPCISIPPLPEKQLTGRYSEDLVLKRRYLLEKWMRRVSRHPVLAQSRIFEHFISTCSETREKEWKDGKRKAEVDKVIGANFFFTISAPPLNVAPHKVEAEVEVFKEFIKNMDDSTRKMIEIGESDWDKVSRAHRDQYKKFSSGIKALGTAFATENAPYSLALTQAMDHTAQQYNDIGDLCADQPKKDMLHVLEVLREYTGLLSTYPEIINVHKGAFAKVKECQKLQEEEKLKYAEVANVSQRMDTITCAMFAEIQHFHRERCRDFKEMMNNYLTEQVRFHQQIISKIQSSIAMFDHVPE